MSTATVVSISGQAWARDSQGNLRELSEGDTLQEGETLVTGPNATVQLEWAGMAGPESVGGGQVVEIGADPEASTPAPFAESGPGNADAEAILSAIEEGEGDLLQLLEDPAAGGSGGSGGGEGGGGHSFVRLERVSESVSPLSFEFGTFSSSDVDIEQGGLAADAEEEIAAADDTFATAEDDPLAGANVLPNDTGVDGSALSVGDPGPRNVTFTLPDGSEVQVSVSVAEDGSISFDPGTTFQSLGEGGSATGTFTYELTDTEGRTDTAEVNLTVNGSNDASPEIVIEDNAPDLANADLSVVEATGDSVSGTATVSAEAGVADVTIGGVSITDASNNPVTIPGEEGVLTVTGYDASTGDITYEYTEDGDAEDHSDGPVQDQFTLNVEDNAGETTSSSLNVRIEDTEPNAVDDTTTSEEDEAVVYNVMGNDDEGADGSTLTSATLADTSQGDIDFGPDGEVTFTPAAGVEGDVVVNYTITDGDGDTSDATLTITMEPDSEPTVEVPTDPSDPSEPSDPIDPNDPDLDDDPASGDALYAVDEAGLPDGSDAAANSETVSGTLDIATGGDDLAAVRMTHNGTTTDVTGGGEITTDLGTLTVTESGGSYSWTYTLDTNSTDHSSDGTAADAVRELFDIQVEDSDGDTADSTLGIGVQDDVPTAVDDSADTGEDTPITYNVLTNSDGTSDTQGVDGATLTAASLADTSQGDIDFGPDGEVTFTPNEGVAGDVVVNYTITDADGDTSDATLTITVAPDSEPEVEVPTDPSDPNEPSEPIDPDDPDLDDDPAAGDALYVVDEAGLPGGSDAAADSETVSGTLDITTGGDGLAAVRVNGTDVTGGGSVTTSLGTLTVSEDGGSYSWTYTLDTNSTDHSSDGTAADAVRELFDIQVEDSDGDTAESTLGIDVQDDVPTAVDDSASAEEGASVEYNVMDNDTQGVDGATLTAATLADPDQGSLSFTPEGDVTFTPNEGVAGDVVVNYTITDADGDTSDATLTIDSPDDSTPSVEIPTDPSDPDNPSEPIDPNDPDEPLDPAVGDALYAVDEAGLPGGSDAAADSETVSGTLDITTGGDGLAAVRVNGTDVTGGGSVTTSLGTLTVSEDVGSYSWTYTLDTNSTDHSDQGTSVDGIRELFDIQVEDSDGDTADSTLGIDVQDDVPTAVDDSTDTAEDTAVTYNVLTNSDGTSDTQGVDGATLTAASLADTSQGDIDFGPDGEVTFTPNEGVAGDVVVNYTITDADGDTRDATLTINVAPDSEPEVEVPTDPTDPNEPSEPIDPDDPDLDDDPAAGDALYVVDEAGLPGGSDAAADSETVSGTLDIATGGDDLAAVRMTHNGTTTDVTGGGEITTDLGTLTVTESGGSYSWTYTLDTNSTDHSSDGTAADAVRELFDIQVEDSDGDTADSTLGIDVQDDVPTAVDDSTDTAEDTAVTYNVLTNSDGTSDTQGVDGATLTAASLADTSQGDIDFGPDGEVTFTPNEGVAGDVVVNYTITDADGDTRDATLTINVAPDSEPEVEVPTDPSDPNEPIDPDDPDLDDDPAAGDALYVVDEAGLPGGSDEAADSETVSGTLDIATGGDDLAAVRMTHNGTTTDVTGGGEITTDLGTLTVTESGGSYSWTYTLDTNSTDHSDQGTSVDGIRELFDIQVEDSDGDTADSTLGIDVKDDAPTLNIVDTPATVTEGETVDGTWTTDSGADTPASVTVTAGGTPQTLDMSATTNSVTLSTPEGELTVNADQTWSFVANDNQDQASGTPSVDFTIATEDADTDTASDNHTIEITDGADPTPGDASGNGSTASLAVDDADTEGPSSSTDTGTIAFTAGSDDLASFTFGTTNPTVTGLASGETLSWTTNGAGDRVATLDSTGEQVLTLSLSNTGTIAAGTSGNVTVTATLAENLPHAASVDSLSISGVEVIAEDIDGGTATGSADIAVADDAPTLNIVDTPATVTEGETVDGTWTTDSGADTPASVTVTAGGTPQTLDMSATTNSVTLSTPEGELTVNADQTWSFVANDNQDQASGTPSVDFTIATEDADTDTASDSHTIEITDGADPTPGDASGNGSTASLAVDDADTEGPSSSTDTGTIAFTAGSDDLASFTFGTTNPTVTGLASGETLSWTTNGDGDRVATLDSTGEQVLTLSLSNTGTIAAGTSGNVTVTATLAENLPHAASVDSLSISGVEVIAEDIDGGTATGSADIAVADDAPTLNIDDTPATVTEGETVDGTWTTDSGADTPASVTVTAGGTSQTLDMSATTNSVTLSTPEGELTVNADQTWSFVANDNQDQASGTPSVTFTIDTEDADDDPASDNHTIEITDGADPTPGDGSGAGSTASLAVDDAETDGTASSTDSGTIAFTAGSDDLTSFAFGTTNPTVTGLASGESLTWSTNPSGQRVASLNGEQVLALTLSNTGTIAAGDSGSVTVEVEQFDALPHAMGGDALTISGVEVIAEDIDGGTATGSAYIEVADDEPSAADDTASTGEEESVTVNVLANDDAGSDTPAVLTGATLVSGQGTVTPDAATGEVTFTPDEGYTGTAQIAYTMEDADGDEASAQLSVEVVPNQLVVGTGGDDPNLEGGGGNDVLIGDPGGTKTVVEPAEDYNIAIILDRSSSMSLDLSNGDTRFEGAQKAINALLEEFVGFSGMINLHINMYDKDGVIQRDFGEFNDDKLSGAQDWVNDQEYGWGTYAEYGFNAATEWFLDQDNDAQDLTYFIADGTESSDSDAEAARDAYDDMIDALVDPIVEAIALDDSVEVEELEYFDTDGDVPVAYSAEQLTNILKGGSTFPEDAELGSDILNGGAGDDILFGDSVDPGNLTGTDPGGDTVNGDPQSGYSGLVDFITEVDGATPDNDRTLEFIKNNYEDLVNTARADGGGDTLNGQAGNDTLIATSGDDTLNGGAGDDQMLGGTGADIFAWTLNDGGTATAPADDTVTDFGDGDDTLQLGELLEGYDATNDGDQSALNDFINASYDGADTVLHIKTDGGIAADNSNADQVITLSGFSEHSGTSLDILQSMTNNNQLDVD